MTGSERKAIVAEAMTKYAPIQSAIELEQAMEIIEKIQPRVIVEIGTYRGGSLRCWQACAVDDAVIVGTDTLGTPPEVDANLQSWLKGKQRGCIFLGDMYSTEFRNKILNYINAPIDFLFIDGNHDMMSVISDYSFWEPYVRSGGLIGFHDILENYAPNIDVPKFWKQLIADRSKLGAWIHELYGSTDPTKAYGIGIVQKK